VIAPSVPLLARGLVLATLLFIPLRILGEGYWPTDDALHHAAKAVSGKDWSEILVLRADVTGDTNPGWRVFESTVDRLTDWDAPALVLFSVIVAFVLVSLGPAVLLRRPEAWLGSLLVLSVTDPRVFARLLAGRPFLVGIAVLIVLCLLRPRLEAKAASWPLLGLVTGLLALATWVHGSWYLFGLPVLACLAARRWRAGARLAGCWAVGVLVGVSLTGTPLAFFWRSLRHPFLVLSGSPLPSVLSSELRPFSGSPLLAALVTATLALRATVGPGLVEDLENSTLLLGVGGWGLGFVAHRFWSDWGMPAVLVWLAEAGQGLIEARLPGRDLRRILLVLTAAIACFLSATLDLHQRWSHIDTTFRPLLAPAATASLPDPGGILYSDDMRAFYQVFFARPRAPWRYLVGFEAALMPPEDLTTLRGILPGRTPQAFAPWVRKMRAEDRLILQSAGRPPVSGLDWQDVGQGIWSGRLPRRAEPLAPGPDRAGTGLHTSRPALLPPPPLATIQLWSLRR
jgi:hypothetical protein